MSEYIQIKNVDFEQILIDGKPYKVSSMEHRDADVAIIYTPMEKSITKIRVVKDKTKRLYNFVRSD